MKKLEELGISPAPWELHECNSSRNFLKNYGDHYRYISAAGNTNKKDCVSAFSIRNGLCERHADARLIAAAPELYEALRDATYEYCHACENGRGNCPKKDGDCFVQKWRAALAKASGESEVAR